MYQDTYQELEKLWKFPVCFFLIAYAMLREIFE